MIKTRELWGGRFPARTEPGCAEHTYPSTKQTFFFSGAVQEGDNGWRTEFGGVFLGSTWLCRFSLFAFWYLLSFFCLSSICKRHRMINSASTWSLSEQTLRLEQVDRTIKTLKIGVQLCWLISRQIVYSICKSGKAWPVDLRVGLNHQAKPRSIYDTVVLRFASSSLAVARWANQLPVVWLMIEKERCGTDPLIR